MTRLIRNATQTTLSRLRSSLNLANLGRRNRCNTTTTSAAFGRHGHGHRRRMPRVSRSQGAGRLRRCAGAHSSRPECHSLEDMALHFWVKTSRPIIYATHGGALFLICLRKGIPLLNERRRVVDGHVVVVRRSLDLVVDAPSGPAPHATQPYRALRVVRLPGTVPALRLRLHLQPPEAPAPRMAWVTAVVFCRTRGLVLCALRLDVLVSGLQLCLLAQYAEAPALWIPRTRCLNGVIILGLRRHGLSCNAKY
mmetsp:Transcript_97378/g.275293  ORF Transcript_97378/g.275293 Transcript_97378/m.275293 type:complete len:252 (+) Transcript_97378:143-898(+)